MKPDKSAEIVREAAARNIAAVLSLPSAGMFRNHKSRFIAELENGLLIEAPSDDRHLIAELLRTQSPCLVSFRSGVHKVNFATQIRRVEPNWQINKETTISALLLEFPTKILATQKRSDYRVEIPPDGEISVRVWRIGDQELLNQTPSAAKEVIAKIRDLSTGGVGVKFVGADGQKPKVCVDDRLRVALTYNNEIMLLEGKMRPPSVAPTGDTISTGIKFKLKEDSLEGRKTHARLVGIVGELQRQEIRMSRLGLMKSA
jgi:hypothetical protein